tara:strand:- start:3360 stop:5138 length:1779 start_codon:yes stop_codon:yes gene_type:complete
MSNRKNIRIVKGSSRFAGAQDKNVGIQPFLSSDVRNMIEGDRNLVLNLQTQFELERETCNTYRMYGNISVLYNNVISGDTDDSEFLNSMFFLPGYLGCPNSGPCTGLPPSDTFNFIPQNNYGPSNTTVYNSLTAYQANWLTYISYVYSSEENESMTFYSNPDTNNLEGLNFIAGDGIPFQLETITIDGRDVARFTSPVAHGLEVGEYIVLQSGSTLSTFPNASNLTTYLTTSYDLQGATYTSIQNTFRVDSLGSEIAGTEKYMINVYLRSLDVTTLPPNPVGTFKRMTNLGNPIEFTSNYYIHKHKLITNPNDYSLDRTGFESGIFNRKGRVFKQKKTPPGYGEKTVIIEEFKSYLWNTNLDINRDDYFDNLNRPIGDLYLTILPSNKNLMWNYQSNQSPAGYGWDWNFRKNGYIDPFLDNNTNWVNLVQTTNNPVNLPPSGTTFRGAFVEYNPYELKETIISEIGHSLKFNKDVIRQPGTNNDYIKSLYRYEPHHRIPIRKFSTSISSNDTLFTSPQYATYSLSEGMFRWRSVLPIGYYEDEVHGVNYPYLNDAHYPHLDLNFNIEPIFSYPDGTLYSGITIINDYIDDCQ